MKNIPFKDDIKSSGKIAIFSYLKIEGGGGQSQITEKSHLKIKTVEDIGAKLSKRTWKATKIKNKVLKPWSLYMAKGWVCTLLGTSVPASTENGN